MAGKVKMLVVLAALTVGAGIYYLLFSEARRKESCSSRGGRWVASRQRCQTRDCYDSSSCLPSYNNSAVCRALPVGISERELVFHLGQPIRVEGSALLFTASPTAGRPIRVLMNEERKAESLDCGGTEPHAGMRRTRARAASYRRG